MLAPQQRDAGPCAKGARAARRPTLGAVGPKEARADRGRGPRMRDSRIVQVVSYPERAVPRGLRAQMIALQEQAWPSEQPPGLAPWHDPSLDPVSVLLVDDDGRVLSALDILSKVIRHAGQTYAASGISAMVTDGRSRGKGLGRALARSAKAMMRDGGADLGIFTCDTHLRGFYQGAGWEHLPGTIVVGGTPEDPLASDELDKVTMASFFSKKANASRERFVGVRIELYSGNIDRLW